MTDGSGEEWEVPQREEILPGPGNLLPPVRRVHQQLRCRLLRRRWWCRLLGRWCRCLGRRRLRWSSREVTVYVVPGHLARVSKKIELAQKDGNVVFLVVVTDGRKLES